MGWLARCLQPQILVITANPRTKNLESHSPSRPQMPSSDFKARGHGHILYTIYLQLAVHSYVSKGV